MLRNRSKNTVSHTPSVQTSLRYKLFQGIGYLSLSAMLILVGIATFNKTKNYGIAYYQGSFENFLEEAAEQEKYALIKFSTDQCLPCGLMEENIFDHNAFISHITRNYIAYDIQREDNIAKRSRLMDTYQVKVLPTTLLLDEAGNVMVRVEGFPSLEQFQAALKGVDINPNGLELIGRGIKKDRPAYTILLEHSMPYEQARAQASERTTSWGDQVWVIPNEKNKDLFSLAVGAYLDKREARVAANELMEKEYRKYTLMKVTDPKIGVDLQNMDLTMR